MRPIHKKAISVNILPRLFFFGGVCFDVMLKQKPCSMFITFYVQVYIDTIYTHTHHIDAFLVTDNKILALFSHIPRKNNKGAGRKKKNSQREQIKTSKFNSTAVQQ